jgi:lipopolysaccharide transport system ATP-binding protein
VASLPEVGTGFHPELTGRENIFLNGAILGMTRAEIRQKFDEIVAFSEVEKFLDTPVKRYSSGMYVRLAFAVAAHLEPEILIVDEVLAVGDAQFQKKCLGKMQDVAKGGRTVLFVSHNMEAVLKLCTRGILVSSGQIAQSGDLGVVVRSYLERNLPKTTRVDLRNQPRPMGAATKAHLVAVLPANEKQGWVFPFGQNFAFDVQLETLQSFNNIELGIGLFSNRGFEVASWTSTYSRTTLPLNFGVNTVRVEYQNFALLPGQYWLGIGIRSDRGFEDYVPEAVRFEIIVSENGAEANTHTFGGIIIPSVDARVLP